MIREITDWRKIRELKRLEEKLLLYHRRDRETYTEMKAAQSLGNGDGRYGTPVEQRHRLASENLDAVKSDIYEIKKGWDPIQKALYDSSQNPTLLDCIKFARRKRGKIERMPEGFLPISEYVGRSVDEKEVIKAMPKFDPEKIIFGMYYFYHGQERAQGHPISYRGQNPLDTDSTTFHYGSNFTPQDCCSESGRAIMWQQAWTSGGQKGIFHSDPYDDITKILWEVSPETYLYIHSTDTEMFGGHMAKVFSVNKDEFMQVKKELVEQGYEDLKHRPNHPRNILPLS